VNVINRLLTPLITRYPAVKDYASLCRIDRPIGIMLLLWPSLSALWIAAGGWPGWHLFLVFLVGVVLTRSAGCVVNDIADRGFDRHVKRTQARPLAQGTIPIENALLFGGLLFLGAFVLVLSTNLMTVALSFVALLIAAVYPFMKRYTHLPQVVLGMAFSMGIPMAFTAVNETVPVYAWVLVIANLLWTVAYDTVYAMVDRDDDIRLGIRSSAILFGDLDKLMIALLQLLTLGCLLLLPKHTSLGLAFYAGLAVAAALFCYQQYLIQHRERDQCFAAFLNNHWVGAALFSGIALDYLLQAPA